MARIKGERKRRSPDAPGLPERTANLVPGWAPLAVAIIGLGILLAPDTDWPLRIAGAALLAGGAFWLGQDRQHDPADRRRILQLERALIGLGILDREDVRADHDPARPAEPAAPLPTRPTGPDDAGVSRRPGRSADDRPHALPDLDAPLPGEE